MNLLRIWLGASVLLCAASVLADTVEPHHVLADRATSEIAVVQGLPAGGLEEATHPNYLVYDYEWPHVLLLESGVIPTHTRAEKEAITRADSLKVILSDFLDIVMGADADTLRGLITLRSYAYEVPRLWKGIEDRFRRVDTTLGAEGALDTLWDACDELSGFCIETGMEDMARVCTQHKTSLEDELKILLPMLARVGPPPPASDKRANKQYRGQKRETKTLIDGQLATSTVLKGLKGLADSIETTARDVLTPILARLQDALRAHCSLLFGEARATALVHGFSALPQEDQALYLLGLRSLISKTDIEAAFAGPGVLTPLFGWDFFHADNPLHTLDLAAHTEALWLHYIVDRPAMLSRQPIFFTWKDMCPTRAGS